MDLNQVTLVGRLANNVTYTEGVGDKAARAVGKLIVNRPPSAGSTEKAYDTIQIVSWGKNADNMAAYTSGGKELGITGSIRTNSVAPTTTNGEWKNYFEIMVRSISFGNDSTSGKLMKALHGGNSLVTAAQDVQKEMTPVTVAPDVKKVSAMLDSNPELRKALESIVHGVIAPSPQPKEVEVKPTPLLVESPFSEA